MAMDTTKLVSAGKDLGEESEMNVQWDFFLLWLGAVEMEEVGFKIWYSHLMTVPFIPWATLSSSISQG